MSREKCDACRSTDCPDKHLCDVTLPSHSCPEGRNPAKARQEAHDIAFQVSRYSTSRKGVGLGRKATTGNRRWTDEQIAEVHKRRNDGETWEAIGLGLGLNPDPTKAKAAAKGIARRHPLTAVEGHLGV